MAHTERLFLYALHAATCTVTVEQGATITSRVHRTPRSTLVGQPHKFLLEGLHDTLNTALHLRLHPAVGRCHTVELSQSKCAQAQLLMSAATRVVTQHHLVHSGNEPLWAGSNLSLKLTAQSLCLVEQDAI